MFKVGDRVRIISQIDNRGISWYDARIGAIGTITSVESGRIYFIDNNAYGTNFTDNMLDLVEGNSKLISAAGAEKNMDIKEKFQLAFKAEPEKSFRKAGVTNGDDYLTEDGQKIFLSWLLKKHGEEFKKEVVDELLQEEKK